MSASVRAVCVPPRLVDSLWPVVRRWIEDAYAHHDCDETVEDAERKLRMGEAFLWLVMDGRLPIACATTELQQASTKKICVITAAGGTRAAEWTHLISAVEDYAKAEHCEVVRMSGRPGWKRVFKDYREPWVTLEKRI